MLRRVKFETRCLARGVNPMKNGPNQPFEKLLTLILVAVWAVLALGGTTQPPDWLLVSLTGFVFALVGRLWGIEADYWLSRLNPIEVRLGGDDGED